MNSQKLKLSIFLFFACLVLSSCFDKEAKQDTSSIDGALSQVDGEGLSKTTAVIKTAKGNIKFKFYPQKAPNTVKRISELIKENFYNGITFHRVVKTPRPFVIQGGDPTGTGSGGSGKKLKAEFNDLKHTPGSIAMARVMSDPDSADSQFYIALSELPDLDNRFTIFAKVVEGMEVAHAIEQGDKMLSVSLIE